MLIINAATLALLWLKKPELPGPPHHREDPIERILREKLAFSEDQLADFRDLKRAHIEEARDIESNNHELRQELFALDYELQKAEVDSLSEILGDNITTLERKTRKHFSEIKALCTPDQMAKFENLLAEVAELLHKRPPRGPSGPPEGPRP